MRISNDELRIIKSLAEKYFGENCSVYIFGSRVDDSKRGGDIDIYVETDLDKDVILNAKIKFLVDLKTAIGDQKVDVVVFNPKFMKEELIHKVARSEGKKI